MAGDPQLHMLAAMQIWSDNDPLAGTIGVQQDHFQRIAEIIMIKLIIAEAVKAHRRTGSHQKVKRGTGRAFISEGR